MITRRLSLGSVVIAGISLLAWVGGDPSNAFSAAGSDVKSEKTKVGQAAGASECFGLDKVLKLHLVLSAKDWQAMQQTRQSGSPGFAGGSNRPDRPAEKKASEDETHRTGFIEFPWVHADLTEEGQTYQNVGLRFKGNFTYMFSMRQLKRSLKIEFDYYDKAAPLFHGLRKFNLHAGVMDPMKVREALSYAFFRAAGVAAPRTAFAEVSLSVPGKYEREYVGLFTLTEQVDKLFLKDRFGTDKGLLMKPLLRGPDYLGETWEGYQDRYRPHRQPSQAEARRIIEFAKLVNNANEEKFRAGIGSYLDVDAFLRFIAVNALVVNLDSPFAMPQNFYLYLNSKTDKFVFFPWDLDLSLAAWPMGGPPEQQMNLSLLHPHVGEHRLIDRLLAMTEVKAKYLDLLKELAATSFSKDQLLKQIETIEHATKEPLEREAKALATRGGGFRFGPPGGGMNAPDPRTFVEKRTESVQAQLAGKSAGYIPTGMMFGPPRLGRPDGPGRPPEPAPPGRSSTDNPPPRSPN